MFFGPKRPSNDHYKRVLHSAIKPGLLSKFNSAKVLAMATRKGIREMEALYFIESISVVTFN